VLICVRPEVFTQEIAQANGHKSCKFPVYTSNQELATMILKYISLHG